MALAVVMLMASILFLLATTVLMLTTYNAQQTTGVTKRNQAMQVAEAGLSEYLYVLNEDPSFWSKDGGVLGPTATAEGTWTVTPSTTPSGSVQLTAVGTLKNGTSRTVKADISFENWSKFIFLVDGPLSIGANAVMDGDVHSNQGISNSGVVTGFASTISGYHCTAPNPNTFALGYPGSPRPGYTDSADKVDFSQLTKDLGEMKTSAVGSGSYYGASGVKGYDVILNGPQVTIYKVSDVETQKPRVKTYPDDPAVINDPPLGTLTYTPSTPVAVAAVPYDGVFYFDDDVWVSGNYSAGITIVSSKNIWCRGNILPSVAGQTATCGLIASNYVLFPWWYATMPANHVVQAALLSQTGGVGQHSLGSQTYANWPTVNLTQMIHKRTGSGTTSKPYVYSWTVDTNYYAPPNVPLKPTATVKGSLGMVFSLGFTTVNNSNVQTAGYSSRSYQKDPILKANPPPRYPRLPGKGLQITTWSDTPTHK
jgi:hypothetical protein